MLKYKIALSMVRGVGLLTYKKLISVFGDDESVFKASRKALSSVSGVGEAIWEQIAAKKVLEWAEEEYTDDITYRIRKSDQYQYSLVEYTCKVQSPNYRIEGKPDYCYKNCSLP